MRVVVSAVAVLLAYAGTATGPLADTGSPIRVSKSVTPDSLKEPGGVVTYSVTITNDSSGLVWIENVVDDRFGDLDDEGGNGCFDAPIGLASRQAVNCTFEAMISGSGDSFHANVAVASGHDEKGNAITAADDARVDIAPRLIDLSMLKDVTQTTQLNKVVRYTLRVRNLGPDTATNVRVADPAPAGITFETATPSQGACEISGVSYHLVTCHLGNLAAGAEVRVEIAALVLERGSHRNTATVTGGGGRETNPADNVDGAVTVVPHCLELAVTPATITVNREQAIQARVTLLEDPVRRVRVKAHGLGVDVVARTNADGLARLRVLARRPGSLVISTPGTRRPTCGLEQIKVVGSP